MTEKGIERRLRNLRVDVMDTDIGSDEEKELHVEIESLKTELKRVRKTSRHREPRNPFSGLTREQLCKSGTCEPDWF